MLKDTHAYAAFISYRHVGRDRKYAKWLHTALETYRLPKKFQRALNRPARIGRVFRDEEELPASAELKAEIDRALVASQFLIVVCSPHTPLSAWVNKEVERFRELGRDDRILALLVEGEPRQSFPRSLVEIRRRVTDAGGLTREQIEDVEPLAADVRETRAESPRHLRRMARLRLLSCILGVRFDDLRRRDQERRRKTLALLSILGMALLIVMAGLTTVALMERTSALAERDRADANAGKALRNQQAATTQAAEADRQRRLSEPRLYFADIGAAEATFSQGRWAESRHWLQDAPRAERNWEWGYMRTRLDASLIAFPNPPLQPAVNAFFSPDEKRVMKVTQHGVELLDAATGKVVTRPREGGDDLFGICAMSRDGTCFLTASHDAIYVCDAATGRGISRLEFSGNSVKCAAFSADGKRVLAGCDNGIVCIRDAVTGQQISLSRSHGTRVNTIELSPDGKSILTASLDHTARVWDAETGKERFSLQHAWEVTTAKYSSDGARIVTASHDKTAEIWDASTGQSLVVLPNHPDPVTFAAFGAGGAWVLTICADGAVRVWDAKGQAIATLAASGTVIGCAAFSPDGSRVAGGCGDGILRIWDSSSGRQIAALHGHEGAIASVQFNHDGSRVLSAAVDGTRIWNPSQPAELVVALGNTDLIRSAVCSHDGTRLLTTAFDTTPRIFDIATGRQITELHGHLDSVNFGCFSSDGNQVVTASADGSVRIWELPSARQINILGVATPPRRSPPGKAEAIKELLATADGHPRLPDHYAATAVSISPDNRDVAAIYSDGSAKLWDAQTGHLRKEFRLEGPIRAAAFSGDGTELIFIRDRLATSRFDVRRLTGIAPVSSDLNLLRPDGSIARLPAVARIGRFLHAADIDQSWSDLPAFSPDGALAVVVPAGKNFADVWDVGAARKVVTLTGHTGQVIAAAFSPDGSRIVTCGWDKTARVWDPITGRELATLAGPLDAVTSATFTRDGRRIIAVSSDKTVRIWDGLPIGER